MKLKHIAAAAAALVVSVGASAQTTSLFGLTSGSFANSVFFTLTGPSDVIGDIDSGGISWAAALLTSNAPQYSSFDSDPTDGFSFLGLSAGSYTLSLIGSGTGGYGGYYTVSAVPEPETYAMMLAGLVAVGFLARRRQG